jgi:hypothetical protein
MTINKRNKMKNRQLLITQRIEPLILPFRDQKVIIDRDLAQIYGVKTSRLNEQVKRNKERFPEDFMFQLTREEAKIWIHSRSHFATLKRGQNIKYLPYAFTEHGAIMAANVINSPLAIQMSVFVVRAFLRLREMVSTHRELSRRLAELEKSLESHDEQIRLILKAIKQLMAAPEKTPKKIGFQLKEKRPRYFARNQNR